MSVQVKENGAWQDLDILVRAGDAIAPAAPTGLEAIPRVEKVLLSWNDNTDADLRGYDVYYSTTAGVTAATGTKANSGAITKTSFEVTGLTGDTTYHFIVVARDTSGNTSAESNEVSATPAAPAGAGQVTLILGSVQSSFGGGLSFSYGHALTASAVAGDYVVLAFAIDGLNEDATLTSGNATLAYKGAPQGGNTHHANIHVYYRKLDSADITNGTVTFSYDLTSSEGVTLTSLELTGVHGTSPIDVTGGDPATDSSDATAGPVAVTTTVGGTYAVAVGSADQSDLVTISVTLNGYTELANNDPNDVAVPALHTAGKEVATAASESGPSYSNAASEECHAALVVFAPAGGDTIAPAAPTGLTALADGAKVNLNWDDNLEADFDHYNVYRSTSSPVSTTAPIASPTASEYVDSSPNADVENFYVVTAVDTSGNESAVSNEESATPTGTASKLPEGAIHDWQFDNATTLADVTGTLDIPVRGAAVVTFGLDFVPAESDICLQDASVDSSPVDELDKAKDWTWCALFKPRTGSDLSHVFSTRHNNNGTRIALQARDNDFHASVYDMATASLLDSVSFDGAGLFTTAFLVTLRWSAADKVLTVWKNDAAVTELAAFGGYVTGANGIAFGGSTSDAYYLDGITARSVIWPRRLSDTDMQTLYQEMQSFASGRGETI
jgi:hypothetical protein